MKLTLNRGFLLLIVAVFGWLASGRVSQAFDSSWNLPVTASWNTAARWTPAGVPFADDDVQAVVNNSGLTGVGPTVSVVLPDVGGIILGVGAGATGRVTFSAGGDLESRLPDPNIWAIPSTTSFGNVIIGQAGRGYLDMTGGKLTLTQTLNANIDVNNPNALYGGNLTVDGEDLATGMGRSRVNLSGNAILDVSGVSTLNRNLRITGPSVNYHTAGNVNFGAASIFTPEITAATHSPVKSDNVINLGGNIAVTYTGVTPVHNQSWTLAEAASINGTFANESGAARDIIPVGVPTPALGESYRLSVVGAATGGNRQLKVGYQKNLVLTVDRTSGAISIRNPLSGPISIDGYTINSAVGSMSTGWSSLDDQNIWGGNWEELVPSVNSLSEFKPSGSFAPGSSQSLGMGFVRDAVASQGLGISGEDLVFQYAVPGVGVVEGQIEYIGTPFLNNIGLLVDPTGVAKIKNDSGTPLNIEAYRIVSSTNALTPGSWTSLDGQNVPNWLAGTGSSFALAEGMTAGSMTVLGQQSLSLGDIGNFADQAAKDGLSLEFLLDGQAAFNVGRVLFVDGLSESLQGDFNNDGNVSAADYTVWRDNLGATEGNLLNGNGNGGVIDSTDYALWKQHFGESGGSGGAAASAVPEPGAGWLLVVGLSAVFMVRGNRKWSLRKMGRAIAIDGDISDELGVNEMIGRFGKQNVFDSFVARARQMAFILGAVVGLLLASPAIAQNLLGNGNFELPALGKFEVGFDPAPAGVGGPDTDPNNPGPGTDVPNWHSSGFDVTTVTWNGESRNSDTGIEVTLLPLPGSSYSGFMNGADSQAGLYASQTTSHVIASADAFNLSIFARPLFTFIEGFGANANATMHWRMYYGGTDSTRGTTFAEGFFDLGVGNAGPYSLYSTGNIIPPVAAVGSVIGISILNSSGGFLGDPAGAVPAAPHQSWIGFDNVGLERVSSVFGDVDFDADVDTADAQIILNNMAVATASFWSEGDINGDDIVNLLDFRAWKNVYSPGAGSGSIVGVPEPSTLTMALVVAGAMSGLCVRRKRKVVSIRGKTSLWSLVIGILTLLTLDLPSNAQTLALPNPDFEAPATVKTEYWDASGAIVPAIIPGWEPTGPGDPDVLGGPAAGPGDSGVEGGGVNDFDTTPSDTDWQGYLAAQDPSIYTVSSTNILASRNYVASVFMSNIYQSDGQATRVNLEMFYVNASSVRVPLGNQNFAVGNGFSNYSFTLTAAQVAAGVGRPLGLEIDHYSDEATSRALIQSWVALDHVVLYADNVLGGAGDVNNDGVVNTTDYTIIKTNFHQPVPSREMGDISGPTGTPDLFVDLYDLRAWKDSVGSGSGGLAGIGVPEPTGLVLAMLAASLTATTRRRRDTLYRK